VRNHTPAVVLITLMLAVLSVVAFQPTPPPADASVGVSAELTTQARSHLREVLARREFQRPDESPSLGDIIRRWLLDVADRLARRFGDDGARAMGFIAKSVAWLVAIVALVVLAIRMYHTSKSRGTWEPIAPAAPRWSSREWVLRAQAALRAGDAREAIRCGYHAVLFRLEEQDVWRVDDSRTPREYLSLLPAQDARRGAFVDLTREFEQTWYGSRTADGHGLLERLEVFGCGAPSEPAI
jgi:hypothetical protein